MSDSKETPLDQTVFGEAAPLMDQNGEEKKPLPVKEVPPVETKPSTKKPIPLPLLLGGIVVLILLVAAVSVVLLPRASQPVQTSETQASATPSIASNLPQELQKAMASLETDIKEADPQANDLPFPPVNFQLHLLTPQASSQ